MIYDGIVISGTSGSGKSSLLEVLKEQVDTIKLLKAVTTREQRADDNEDQYEYLTPEEYNDACLIIKAEYRDSKYGIRCSEWTKTSGGMIPTMILTPSSVDPSNNDFFNRFTLLKIFIDADDEILDKRLESRSSNQLDGDKVMRQRTIDRSYLHWFTYRLKNNGDSGLNHLASVIKRIIKQSGSGGLISKKTITDLVKYDCLLENSKLDNIQGASYDLRLGDEYYYKGRINSLTESMPFVTIDPYDYVIVTSREIANMPLDIAGRFDIRVNLFCQGVILSNGTQVDPGFRGKLFCLLFNTSNSPVILKRREHYATVEFIKLLEPTESYKSKYQNKLDIIHYLPSNTLQGGVSEIKKDLENLRTDTKNLQNLFLGIISLVLAIIAMIIAID